LVQRPSFTYMSASCKHPQVRVVAREEDAEFVECQLCGEVFDSSEFPDILNEEDTLEEQEAQGPSAPGSPSEQPSGGALKR
jgi:hypothetical protein